MKPTPGMIRFTEPGRIIFSTGIAALGVLGMLHRDFIVGRPPAWPESITVNPGLAYISGIVLILAAAAIVLKKKADTAALLIAALIFLLSVLRHLPVFMNDWANGFKCLALMGGSMIVACSFFQVEGNNATLLRFNERFRTRLVTVGCILLGVFFLACGYAHFKYVDFVNSLIPSFIPFHTFWTYFCGICLLAGGVGLLIPQTIKWTALLSGIMVLGWFLLLHVPRFLADPGNQSDQMGVFESFTFVGVFFVLAGMLEAEIEHKPIT